MAKFLKNDQLRYSILATIVFGLIILYVFEISWFQRTLHATPLLLFSLLIGSIIGLIAAYYYRDSAEDLTERVQIYIFFLVVGMTFAPLLGSLSNRLLARSAVREVPAVVYHIQAKYASAYGVIKGEKPAVTQWKIALETPDGLLQLILKEPIFTEVERGDSLYLHVKKGLWGAEFLDLEKLKIVKQ